MAFRKRNRGSRTFRDKSGKVVRKWVSFDDTLTLAIGAAAALDSSVLVAVTDYDFAETTLERTGVTMMGGFMWISPWSDLAVTAPAVLRMGIHRCDSGLSLSAAVGAYADPRVLAQWNDLDWLWTWSGHLETATGLVTYGPCNSGEPVRIKVKRRLKNQALVLVAACDIGVANQDLTIDVVGKFMLKFSGG